MNGGLSHFKKSIVEMKAARHHTGILRTDKQFWADLILRAGKIDFGDPLPVLVERFVSIWASHYATIAGMTRPKDPILEIGAGYAVLASGLAQLHDVRVYTTEHPTRAYVFRRSYQEFLRSHGIFLVAQDLREGLPFRKNSFNHVYGCDVIEHLLPNDEQTFMAEIVRVLKPGGELILSTPNASRLGVRLLKLLGQPVPATERTAYAGDTLGHVREYTLSDITGRMRRHGLRPVHHAFGLIPFFAEEDFVNCKYRPQPFARWVNQLSARLTRLFPSLGDEIYIMSQKP